ncbi:hypothetical protein JOE58_001581 [Curtobacterium luteum]|uniref:Uncharacterized protein n=1 Tax=Curtobacterium luteum TaxID=33881 RepID=A0A8H9G7A6_9MICO|nr:MULTISPECIES: hypothetical protein [Curtobacterium]MBM7802330.1 hypothetical protein [Curtobacterium luteum]NUU52434.1 hypothetical protein [Curtobacterium luteum]GGK91962.1 hypothetical protein GCM10009769_07660 [Curtobacterium luteum]
MTDTTNDRPGSQRHPVRQHLLAQARVRALAARPVGPFRVTTAHARRAGAR